MKAVARSTALPPAAGFGRPRLTPRVRKALLTTISLSSLLVFWTLASGTLVDDLILPPPAAVASETVRMARDGELFTHVWASASRVLLGYSGACVVAVLLGLTAGRAALVRGLTLPILNLLRPISPTALVPLMIVWFGIGELSKVLLVGYTAFIVVFFNTLSGVASVPITRERAARTLGAGSLDVFRLVVLPSAVPYILTGMRIGLGLSFMSVVAAELIAADKGIGFLIMQSRFSMLTERMFVGLVCLAALGLIGDWIFRRLIKRFGRAYVDRQLTEMF